MKQSEIVDGLSELANNLGIIIRKEKGVFTEGLCTVNDKKIILISKNSPTQRIIRVLANAISSLDIEDLYIKPYLREVLDFEMQKRVLLNKNDIY